MVLLKAFYPDGPTLSAINRYIYTRIAPDGTDGSTANPNNLASCCGFISAVIEAGHTGDVIPQEEVLELINVAFPLLQDFLGML